MKKLKQPLLYTLSALSSVVVDLGLFYLLRLLLGGVLGAFAESVCTVGARVVSSFYNFNMNNRMVFQNKGSYGKAMLRYYCLALPQLAASALLLTLFVRLLGVTTAQGSTVVKLVVDSCLFVASFFIQKFWVFAQKNK
ncbi:MAG: GtrA family protein [Oscillospiraceae bacterium]|nr:GtrA family protein [Oscillospiraceae bacterium]